MNEAASNCPNCGAPAKGLACEYCGTVFAPHQALSLALGRPVSVRFEYDGMEYEFDMVVERTDIDCYSNPTNYYADGKVAFTSFSPEYSASFSGHVVPREIDGKMHAMVARCVERGLLTTNEARRLLDG